MNNTTRRLIYLAITLAILLADRLGDLPTRGDVYSITNGFDVTLYQLLHLFR